MIRQHWRSAFVTFMLSLSVSSTQSPSAETGDIARAKAMVETYRQSLDHLTDAADDLTPLRRLRAKSPILASLSDLNIENDVLAHYRPRNANGEILADDAAAGQVEDFMHLMNDVALSAASLGRCIAAIDTPEAQDKGFMGLPVGHAMLAARFLPAAVVESALRAADLIDKHTTISEREVDDLETALLTAVSFSRIEHEGSIRCDEIVSSYTNIALRDDADPGFIIRLDAAAAHTEIDLLP